jgi:hypothetical protein
MPLSSGPNSHQGPMLVRGGKCGEEHTRPLNISAEPSPLNKARRSPESQYSQTGATGWKQNPIAMERERPASAETV